MIARRVLAAIPMLFLISLVSFSLMRALPGDPVDVMLGSAQKELPPADLQVLRREFGLDQSPAKQYMLWLSGWVKSDTLESNNALGRSYRDGRPVKEVIFERIPATLILVGMALIIAFVLGPPLGALAALLNLSGKNKQADIALTGALLALYSAPNFWLAFLLLAALANQTVSSYINLPILGIHPPGEAISVGSAVTYLALPAVILAVRRMAKVALYVRTLALEELGKEYVLAALAKGLSLREVIERHVLKNCLLPVVNLFGLSLPALIGGSVLIETIFCVPGMGRLMVESTFGRNYPVLLALVMLYGTIVILANLLADVLNNLIDPRLRQ
jgi:peptide/nickel transport system permease protein